MNGGLTIRDMEDRKRKAAAYDWLMYRRQVRARYVQRHREEVNARRRVRNADGSMKTDAELDTEALRWCEQ